MRFEAYKDNVFVLVERGGRVSAGGIVLPDTTASSEFGPKVLSGYVVKAGPGGYSDGTFYEVDVEVGDRVLLKWDAGERVVVGEDIEHESAPDFQPGTELRILRSSEILGVV